MTEADLHLISFVSYVSFASGQPTALAEYRKATGDTYAFPENALDQMIDKATGADREFVRRFVDWCAGHYGRDYLPADFLDRVVPPAQVAA